MNEPLIIQPGNERPSGRPAGRINIAFGGKPEHVDQAIAAGVNMICLQFWRWKNSYTPDRIWAKNYDINRVETRLAELGWAPWSEDRQCWYPKEDNA